MITSTTQVCFSLQGAIITLPYCFLNSEVRGVLSLHWSRFWFIILTATLFTAFPGQVAAGAQCGGQGGVPDLSHAGPGGRLGADHGRLQEEVPGHHQGGDHGAAHPDLQALPGVTNVAIKKWLRIFRGYNLRQMSCHKLSKCV